MSKYLDENGHRAAVEDAFENSRLMKRAVAEKNEIYGGGYVLALLTCVVLIFYPGWIRWVAGFFVLLCLVTAWDIRNLLAELASFVAYWELKDAVLRKHQLLNYLALGLLTYAFGAIFMSWSAPALAVFLATLINMAHYAGYRRYITDVSV